LAEELGLHGVNIHSLVKFKMEYGPKDREICQLYEGRVDPTRACFDPVEIEWLASYSLMELDAQIGVG